MENSQNSQSNGSIVASILHLPFLRNTIKLSLSNVVTLLISILVTPLLSRLYSPEEYGDWGIFSSFVVIVISVIFLSYENTIVKSNDKNELPSLICLCLIVSSLISIFIGFVFFLGASCELSFFVSFPSLFYLLFALVVGSFNTIGYFASNRYALYNSMSIASLLMGGGQALSRIVLGVAPLRQGLIIGNLIGVSFSLIFLFYNLRAKFKARYLKYISIKEILQLAIKYKKFPLFDAPAQLISFSTVNIAILILSLYFRKNEIGNFSMVINLVLIPITLFGYSLSTVFFKELSNIQNHMSSIHSLTMKTVKVCICLSVLPSIVLVFGGDYLLFLFLGNQWGLSCKMALCLAILSIPVILSEPLLPIFKILDKQDLYFILNAFNICLILVCIFVGVTLTNDILKVLIIYSIATGFSRFLMFRIQLKLVDISFKDIRIEMLMIFAIYILLSIRLYYIF